MSGAATLEAFCHDPARWADPAAVAAHLAPGLRAETARRLLTSPRTASRASALLAGPGGDGAALADPDAALVLGPPAHLALIGACCGAVLHAGRVRAMLRGADIAAFNARFGAAAREAAFRHAPPFAVPAGGDLVDDVAREASLCIAAWRAGLPGWVERRLALVLGPPARLDGAETAPRAALLRRLATETGR